MTINADKQHRWLGPILSRHEREVWRCIHCGTQRRIALGTKTVWLYKVPCGKWMYDFPRITAPLTCPPQPSCRHNCVTNECRNVSIEKDATQPTREAQSDE